MRFYLSLCTVFILLFSGTLLTHCKAPDLPSDSDDDNENPNNETGNNNRRDDSFTSKINRVGLNFNVEEFFGSAVYIYTLYSKSCPSDNDKSNHKTCVIGCNSKTGEEYIKCVKGGDGQQGCDREHNGCTTAWGIGSGVFESSTTVLTNYHVAKYSIGDETDSDVAGTYHIGTSIENYSGKDTTLKSFKWYKKNDDVALIELNNKLDGYDVPEKGSLSSLKILDELFTIGNPGGIKWVASLGHLTKKETRSEDCEDGEGGEWTNCILFSIPSGGENSGNSGGPVFDANGKLVGLLAFSRVVNGNSGNIPYDNLSGGPHIDIIKTHIDNKPNAPTSNSASRQLAMQSERTFRRVFNTRRPSKRQKEKFAGNIKDAVMSLSRR